jgi:hypothetical protein
VSALGLLAVEVGLGAIELALGLLDPALEPADAVAEALDRRRQHALLLLGGLDLVLLLVDAIGQGRTDAGQGHQQVGRQAEGDWDPEALLHLNVSVARLRG